MYSLEGFLAVLKAAFAYLGALLELPHLSPSAYKADALWALVAKVFLVKLMLWFALAFSILAIAGFMFEKHLFCYFLLLEAFILGLLFVFGEVCSVLYQSNWFLIFISMAVVESVLGLCLYLSFLRLNRVRHSRVTNPV